MLLTLTRGPGVAGLHFDKDYACEDSGLNVHPQLGTVTYLSDLGVRLAPRYFSIASAKSVVTGARVTIGKEMSSDIPA
jgi:hypothetical protein